MSEWISVDDRMPQEYTPVACLSVCPYEGELLSTAGVMHESLGFFVFNEDGDIDPELRDVRFWQPIPGPDK